MVLSFMPEISDEKFILIGSVYVCYLDHTYMNVILKSVYMFDIEEGIWIRLPDFPVSMQ